MVKVTRLSALILGGVVAANAVAADGQIRINGEVTSKTCEVAINGATTSALLSLDAVAIQDLKTPLRSARGTSHDASRNMRTVDVTLQNCSLPSGKSKVAVSFDSSGYADANTSTYRNILLDSVNTMDLAAKGVQIGFTKPAGTDLLMDMNTLSEPDYKDPVTSAQTFSFETHYVQTAANVADVTAGDMETVATFSLVYM
ncbi:fimbrial protein [Chimaeribacter californicus]|uniref:fimbrial protein n=1 Tax=Chimaeribacter californicus TaxID=2060067 RepID=UPI0011AECF6A|nr:fimbrial protein [Chimaeribacter californicus]